MVPLTDTRQGASQTAIIAIAITKSVGHNVGTKTGDKEMKLLETVLLWCK